ncbi:hypothetical protein [Bacteroides helcogenes]|uniref:DNA replication protein DnaC n=1 Tax=Bacteroides helcogenes (strain ATCC 35417 / DSM 20613 / JCM 6297 / CCUG 15421 / P 36-108) TaxID=693979 RepID=E6SUB6_BACT6|nr:hypothetical protein [Bacteroides helcogenes]ADV42334.1 hypothetical protein Bache_0305 [Bacteroides helcogenes P 36-108]MDY5237210.1 hypothetical protein [Bacteroides helcogenes]
MNTEDFKNTIENMKDLGFNPNPNVFQMEIPNAKDVLWRGIKYFTGNAAKWQPEYDEAAKWLENNHGKGLLCLGNCGRGKTLICGKILPVVLNFYYHKNLTCIDSIEINNKIDALKNQNFVYIDDIGVENQSIRFGEKRWAFPELVDAAEKRGHFLVVSTNFTVEELAQKYGVRTLDRLRAITTPILFSGESMRK